MRRGFTLAEVLITLGIIGVVAAMTLPTVIQNYQKHKTVNQLKKVYTVLNQAFKMSEMDNEQYEYWSTISEIGREPYIEKYWRPYLKVIKICSTLSDCGYPIKSEYIWRNANDTAYAQKGLNTYNLITNDGTFMMITDTAIYIDLNAGQGPNRYGRFYFFSYK